MTNMILLCLALCVLNLISLAAFVVFFVNYQKQIAACQFVNEAHFDWLHFEIDLIAKSKKKCKKDKQ